MKKRMKYIFATLLVIAMVTSVVPQGALADEQPKKVTVSTQEELDAALKNSKLTALTIESDESLKFVIKSNILPNLTVTLILPQGTVTNNASIKKLNVKSAKSLTEKASGNKIDISDDKLTLKVAKDSKVSAINVNSENANVKMTNNGSVDSLNVKGSQADITVTNNGILDNLYAHGAEADIKLSNSGSINTMSVRGVQSDVEISNGGNISTLGVRGEGSTLSLTNDAEIKNLNVKGGEGDIKVTNNGNLKKLNVYAESAIAINGSTKSKTNVIVKPNAQGASIETSTPVKLSAAAEVNVSLLKGAGLSSITLTSEEAGVKLVNETAKKISVTDAEGNIQKVKAGTEASVGETSSLVQPVITDEKTEETPEEMPEGIIEEAVKDKEDETVEEKDEKKNEEKIIIIVNPEKKKEEKPGPDVPVVQPYTTVTEVVTKSGIGYNQTTYFLNDRAEKVEVRTLDSDELYSEEKFTYYADTWVSEYTAYSPKQYTLITKYDTNTSRPLSKEMSSPSAPEYDTKVVYSYEGDICTCETTQYSGTEKTIVTQVYTTDATGTTVIKVLSEDTSIYEGNSDTLKTSLFWYFTDEGLLMVETKDRLDNGDMQTISRVYYSSITEFGGKSDTFLNDSSLLIKRNTVISRPDGSVISEMSETGDNLYNIVTVTYDEYGNPLSLTQMKPKGTDSTVTVVENFFYSGEGTSKVLTERIAKRIQDNVLISTGRSTFEKDNGKYFIDDVSIYYEYDGITRKSRTECRHEILNGKTIFTMGQDDMRTWLEKSYSYYSVLDDMTNYYYRLISEKEYEYNLTTSDYYSKFIYTQYFYNDSSVEGYTNTFTCSTTEMNEDGTGTSVESGTVGFIPEENVHLFKESIS